MSTNIYGPPGGPLPAGVFATVDPRIADSGFAVSAANAMRGVRFVVPATGTLTTLGYYVVTSSGNIDVGIYSTAATRELLWSTGSIACPSATAWATASPNLPVTAGQQIDIGIAADNTTAQFARHGQQAVAVLPASLWPGGGGAQAKVAFAAMSAFPLPATISEASVILSGTAFCFLVAIA